MQSKRSVFIRSCAWMLLTAAGLLPGLAPAQASDPSVGRMIAQKWCSSCHLVEPGGKTIDAAPSFAMIANNERYTESRLRGWIFAPHPPMPQIQLTKTQTDAIIAYILSMKGQ
ncbi:MAG: hypothetical protein RIB59_15475 [Rhodospirillales bacterium]